MKYLNVTKIATLLTAAIFTLGYSSGNSPAPKGMVLIPAGTVSGGSVTGGSITITDSFYMDETEVTQKRYSEVMTEVYGYLGYTDPNWKTLYGVGDDYPAYYLDWYDALLFCNAISKINGIDTIYSYTSIIDTPGNGCELADLVIDTTQYGFRLPSKTEREYAHRAGTNTDFYWCNGSWPTYPATKSDTLEMNSYAVWKGNSGDQGIAHPGYGTHRVGQTIPNAFGLYDMTGNVSEWTNTTLYVYWLSVYSLGGSWSLTNLGQTASLHNLAIMPIEQFGTTGFRTILPVYEN